MLRLSNLCFIFLILMTTYSYADAEATSATEVLNQIHRDYNSRFDANGKYIKDQNLTLNFKALQNNAIQILQQNGYMGKTFLIKNSAMSDLVITVQIIKETNGDFAGLFIHRNKYKSVEEESYLRLFSLTILKGGMDLLTLDGRSVIHIKSDANLSEKGGQLGSRYPTDFNDGSFQQNHLLISKSAQQIDFLQSNQQNFSEIFLDIWYSIFSQNFGVSSFDFR